MKFKIGDRVRFFCEKGTIRDYEKFNDKYLIETDSGICDAIFIRPTSVYWGVWVEEKNITLLDENDDKNLEYKNIKGEWNNMNNFEKILEIYRERKINLIDEEAKDIIDSLLLKEDIERITDDIIKKTFKDFPDFKEMIDIKLTVVPTDKGMKEIVNPNEEAKKLSYQELDKLLEEVKAQLSLAETYEQKIDILVRYEILDKKTKKLMI